MSNAAPSLIFMGTPEFSVPTLEALINSGDFLVKAVIKPLRRYVKLGDLQKFSPCLGEAIEMDMIEKIEGK